MVGFAKAVKTGMESRTARRLQRQHEKSPESYIKANSARGKLVDQKIDQIRVMLTEAGVKTVDGVQLKFHRANAADGVDAGVRRLAYNPDGDKEENWLPWTHKARSFSYWRKIMERLVVPQVARDLKASALESFSNPATTGMLRKDGTPNKDLSALLVNAPAPRLDAELSEAWNFAMDRLVSEFIAWHGGKLKLDIWTYEKFRKEMSKAIKSSSPGYPFNGFGWDEDLGDMSTTEAVYNDGVSWITDDNQDPWIFIQGARYTGDGGSEDDIDADGKQRLVQMAPACEKLIGHIISEFLKAFFKVPPGSGQRGIQAVTSRVKQLAQGKAEPYHSKHSIFAWCSADVSQWDTSQSDELAEIGFFAFLDRICDTEDELTMRILSRYKSGYMNRVLYTAMGFLKPNFLPSGASVTTVLAFTHHTLLLYSIDYIWELVSGVPLFAEFGLQGDDQWAALTSYSPAVVEVYNRVYNAFHCKIKGDFRVRLQSDKDATVVFLNECIRLHTREEDDNIRFPKWSMFLAENAATLYKGGNIDRMLLDEITKKVAHPTNRELLMASFIAKMERFVGAPFYNYLLQSCLRNGTYWLRSWVAERFDTTSHTIQKLKEWEAAQGISHPGPIEAAADREEDMWLAADEIAQVAASLYILGNYAQSVSPVRRIIKFGRNYTQAWRRSGREVEHAGPDVDFINMTAKQVGKLAAELYEARYVDISAAFAAEIRHREEAAKEAAAVTRREEGASETMGLDAAQNSFEPVQAQTLIRATLSCNQANPYELVKETLKGIVALRKSVQWNNIPDSEREILEQTYATLTGARLQEDPESDLAALAAS